MEIAYPLKAYYVTSLHEVIETTFAEPSEFYTITIQDNELLVKSDSLYDTSYFLNRIDALNSAKEGLEDKMKSLQAQFSRVKNRHANICEEIHEATTLKN